MGAVSRNGAHTNWRGVPPHGLPPDGLPSRGTPPSRTPTGRLRLPDDRELDGGARGFELAKRLLEGGEGTAASELFGEERARQRQFLPSELHLHLLDGNGLNVVEHVEIFPLQIC